MPTTLVLELSLFICQIKSSKYSQKYSAPKIAQHSKVRPSFDLHNMFFIALDHVAMQTLICNQGGQD